MRIGQRLSKGCGRREPVSAYGGGAGRHRSDGRQSGQPDGGGDCGHGADEHLFQGAPPTLGRRFRHLRGAVGATLRQIATVFFADLLLGLIHGLLMPMVYLYAGALAAGCCLADKRLTAVAELLKTVCTKLLTAALLTFTLYLTVGGIFAGTVDSARVRVTKTAISGMIPVVGGIIAEASETVLAGAGLLKGPSACLACWGCWPCVPIPFCSWGSSTFSTS